MVEIHGLIHQFKQNPVYTYFLGLLQALADEGTRQVLSGQFSQRDLIEILEREQTIGAAPAYLKFGQMVEELQEQLQIEIKKQEEQNGPQ